MSFQEIKQKYQLSNKDHFRYLQIRDIYNKEIGMQDALILVDPKVFQESAPNKMFQKF